MIDPQVFRQVIQLIRVFILLASGKNVPTINEI